MPSAGHVAAALVWFVFLFPGGVPCQTPADAELEPGDAPARADDPRPATLRIELAPPRPSSWWCQVDPLAPGAEPQFRWVEGADSVSVPIPRRLPVMVCVGTEGAGILCTYLVAEHDDSKRLTLSAGRSAVGRLFVGDCPATRADVRLVPDRTVGSVPFTMPLSATRTGVIRAVLTDATGSFRVPGIAPGTYMLDVLATTGQRWTSEPFTVPSPDRHEAGKRIEILPLGEFHLPVGAELEVLAVDALTGAGLAGATVLANQGENVADVVMFETKVNDVGRALLQGLRFEEPAHVKVAAPGYTACEITAVIAPTSVTCSLRPLARIAGRVVARDDTPIPGAAIGFRGTERAHHANDDGRFAIEGVESGTVDLTVAAPGYRPAALRVYVAAGESGEIGEVELEAGERMTFLVQDADDADPIEGATVRSVAPVGAFQGMTDAAGLLEVVAGVENDLTVEVAARGYPIARRRVLADDVASGKEVVVELSRGGRLRIEVWDETGQPCAGCSAFFHGPGGSAGTVRLAADGSGLSEELAAGSYTVTAATTAVRGSVVTVEGGGVTKTCTVRPGATTTVSFGQRGDTVTLRLMPPPGPGWELVSSDGHDVRFLTIGHDGRVAVPFAPGRSTEVRLWQPSSSSSSLIATLPATFRGRTTEIQLGRATVTGFVRDAQGPHGGTRVRLLDVSQGGVARAGCDSDSSGAFVLRFLPPSVYALTLNGQTVRTLVLDGSETHDLGEVVGPAP